MANMADDSHSKIIAHYYLPSEYFVDSCCNKIGLEHSRKNYLEFIQKIDIYDINSDSKPASYLQSTTDNYGFSSFSELFCLNDYPQITDIIKKSINDCFIDKYCDVLDKETLKRTIFSKTLTEEHIKFVTEYFKFKILIYSDGEWKKFGDFGNVESAVFPMEKKVTEDGISFKIIASLQD